MIQRIKTHNLLNGLIFSMVEFLVIALVVSPFAVYYVVHSQVIYALVSVGIFINCLTVALIGWRQWRSNEQRIVLRQLTAKKKREEIGRANPHLLADTVTITIAALLPFVLMALVSIELLSGREHTS